MQCKQHAILVNFLFQVFCNAPIPPRQPEFVIPPAGRLVPLEGSLKHAGTIDILLNLATH